MKLLNFSLFSGIFVLGSLVEINWDLQWIPQIKNPWNQNQSRKMIGVNGKWPLDQITLLVGDTLVQNITTLFIPLSIPQNYTSYFISHNYIMQAIHKQHTSNR